MITFNCSCGKVLQVKDEHAGKRVRCPECQEISVAQAEPAFEVVDEDEAPLPIAKPTRAKSADEDEDDRPRKKRRDDDDDDDRPRRKKKKLKSKKPPREEEAKHFGFERGIANSGVAGGIIAMIVAVAWFVIGFMNDRIFIYPPILFVVGVAAFIKGLMGGGSDD